MASVFFSYSHKDEDLRDRLIGWLDDRPRTLGAFVAALITCPWCTGV